MATPTSYLTAALRDLDAWTRYFRDAQIPVLAKTSQALEALRADVALRLAEDSLKTTQAFSSAAQTQLEAGDATTQAARHACRREAAHERVQDEVAPG